MGVRVLGIRHHSPACARLVRELVANERPDAVLIEGPCDFNGRMPELLLPHRLPVALYSYANAGPVAAQSWFPFLDYSPEWVALRAGHEHGAKVRFIDLPHWQYRTVPDARERVRRGPETLGRERYGEVVDALCRLFGCDSDIALWDHLFEDEDDLPTLADRLHRYFDELRAGDPGTPQDQAREECMARWVAWTRRELGAEAKLLVVCGGWHQKAIEDRWPTAPTDEEPAIRAPEDPREAGCYLVPFEYRQVDALGGYRAGMQSPMFYQWMWDHGAAAAAERAIAQIVRRLRAKDVAFSTAEFVALQQTVAGLAHLRERERPARHDVLDALQSTAIKEALEAPPPWSTDGLLRGEHHPVLREALLALTGEGGGELAPDTPLPPLVHDIAARLQAADLAPSTEARRIVLDRRRPEDLPRAHLLWQLALIGVRGARLVETKAPTAARRLPESLRYEEHWSLVRDQHWFPDVIEAAAYGATLEAAARQRLAERVRGVEGDLAEAARCLLQAVRAGLADMGEALAAALQAAIPMTHDVAPLAAAGRVLLQVLQAGFWGEDTQAVLLASLHVIAARLLRLLEDRQGTPAGSIESDVDAVGVIDALLREPPSAEDALDRKAALETLLRLAQTAATPPALRGAALGVSYANEALGDDAPARLLAVLRSVPPRDALGDFLYGLFSCARALATGSEDLVTAVHESIEAMSNEDFLVALPQLRGAFGWFPPRERGAIADRVARLLGLSASEQSRLLALRGGTDSMIDAKRVEALALSWARELGIETP